MNRILKYLYLTTGLVAVYLLYLIFQGKLIVPQGLHIGLLHLRYFGIVLALAVLAAYVLAIKRASLYQIDKDEAEDFIFLVIVGGFIGARAYHVLSSLPYYLQHPIDILMVWHGGLSVIGSLIGGLVVVCLKAKKIRHSVLGLLDWLAPSMVLGQIIGRFADLFNYELFGYPTNLPWKMFVPVDFRPAAYIGANFFHPLFLYEALGNTLILFWLLWKTKRNNEKGGIFFTYLVLYGILRFFLEFLRIDSVFIGGLRLNALVSLAFVLIGFIGLYSGRKRISETRA